MDTYKQGLDEEIVETPKIEETKPKRAPYSTWKVGDTEYKLRLTAVDIAKLEGIYRRNLLLYLTDDGIPAVADMLTVIQAAMRTYHHGIKYVTVQGLYDAYVDEGGDQNSLMADVLMPLLAVSGFFTPDQAKMIEDEMKDITSSI